MGARSKNKSMGRAQKTIHPSASSQKYLFGQYFSRTDVVDLILGFCVKSADLPLLDPSCGNGVFLLRAFTRLKYLNPHLDPINILKKLWCTDVEESLVAETREKLNKIAGIPLSDWQSSKKIPQIVTVDFFDCLATTETSPEISVKVDPPLLPCMGAIIGNPPYTRQEILDGLNAGKNYKDKLTNVIKRDFDLTISGRAGIYAYFLLHSTIFLSA